MTVPKCDAATVIALKHVFGILIEVSRTAVDAENDRLMASNPV
jgi:hypothetical protein